MVLCEMQPNYTHDFLTLSKPKVHQVPMGFLFHSYHSFGVEKKFAGQTFSTKLSRNRFRLSLQRQPSVHRKTRYFLQNLVSHSSGAFRSPRWEQSADFYLLRPTSNRNPLGVVHFVGGAFVSSISQLAYRSLLEGLAQKGYLVVVTPYDTSFDHLVAAEAVNSTFIRVMRQLREEYQAELHVVGLSHSLGCIIQILSTCLFPSEDVVTKGHIFMAYNNKPLNKAVPLYKEIFIPSINMFSSWVMPKEARSNNNWRKMASLVEDFIVSTGDSIVKSIDSKGLEEFVYPTWQQLQRAWKQLDPLLEQVQSGRDEFHPSPSDIENIIIQKYSRPSVLIRCEDDLIDESAQLYRLLRGRKLFLKLKSVPGSHLTPLEQNNAQAVDNFLKTNFPISSFVSSNRNLPRLMEVIDGSIADILLQPQASVGIEGQ